MLYIPWLNWLNDTTGFRSLKLKSFSMFNKSETFTNHIGYNFSCTSSAPDTPAAELQHAPIPGLRRMPKGLGVLSQNFNGVDSTHPNKGF
jgi:hypothetical protein